MLINRKAGPGCERTGLSLQFTKQLKDQPLVDSVNRMHPLLAPACIVQRPDGIYIEWTARLLIILEFTRPLDHSIANLRVTDAMKQTKYRDLNGCLLAVLARRTTDIATFTVGVKGSIDTVQGKKTLDMLRVPPALHAKAARMATSKALDGIGTLMQAPI